MGFLILQQTYDNFSEFLRNNNILNLLYSKQAKRVSQSTQTK